MMYIPPRDARCSSVYPSAGPSWASHFATLVHLGAFRRRQWDRVGLLQLPSPTRLRECYARTLDRFAIRTPLPDAGGRPRLRERSPPPSSGRPTHLGGQQLDATPDRSFRRDRVAEDQAPLLRRDADAMDGGVELAVAAATAQPMADLLAGPDRDRRSASPTSPEVTWWSRPHSGKSRAAIASPAPPAMPSHPSVMGRIELWQHLEGR